MRKARARRRLPRVPALSARGEAERAALGVAADRPPLAGVNDDAAEFGDKQQGALDVVDREVGERERVAGSAPAFVNADRDRLSVAVCLPARSLAVAAIVERGAEQARPEPPGAGRVVGGELDQAGAGGAHACHHNAIDAIYGTYVALGDSSTEGLDDPHPDGGYRGWADRLAEHLALRRPDLLYANLAVRGRLIGRVRAEQLEPALAMRPDLASVVAGLNDILRPRVAMSEVADHMEAMQRAFVDQGAAVISITLPDLSTSMPIARLVRSRVIAYNAALRTIAERTGAILIDLAANPVSADSALWSADRLHASSLGHTYVAAVVAEALGLPAAGDPEELYAGGPTADGPPATPPTRGRVSVATTELAWAWRHLTPWVIRRLRGRSSGDLIEPKRPRLEPVTAQPRSRALR